ncbi:DUF4102 domain-containing protein [Tardiphaga alba]|uniref:DUF4102 domain-containing protein n=1 Tax=Tardiphaga alba TaxID=340268 RepID=A0ABX8ACG5_9BRAD|nr:integrase arm-type DNA-binding domain-containing protein [Tardiphaga alba]QUS40661.1 DUF4102 domain-containing protein [Tardiphaga alba]
MLTDAKCRNAKARESAYKLSDSEGLHLLVRPSGTKAWRLSYRFLRKQKSLALGTYPAVGLSAARTAKDEAKQLLARGVDPSHQRKLDRSATERSYATTFKAVADELIAKFEKENYSAVTLQKKRWLVSLAEPEIGSRPVASISPPELLDALRKVEKRGTYETANRLRSFAGSVFRFAIATGRADRDPAQDLRGALITPTVKHHAAITDPKKLGALLRAIDGIDGSFIVKQALKFTPLVFVRPGELRGAKWTEFDHKSAVWRIPAERMKMDREHRVPLAPQALQILAELHPITGSSPFVFPSVRSWHRPMSENTINAALRRLGYTGEEMTAHGFRTTASTLLNEMQEWSPDVIERQLAHQEPNEARRAYMHAAEFWKERVSMMSAWADYLDGARHFPA